MRTTPTALNSKAQRRAAHAGFLCRSQPKPQSGFHSAVEPRLGFVWRIIYTQCALRDTGLWSKNPLG